MANDPWAEFRTSPAPAAPSAPQVRNDPVLSGPDPFKVKADARAQAGESRAAVDQSLQIEKAAREKLEWGATHNPDGTPKKPLENVPAAAANGIQENLKVIADIRAAIAALDTRPQSVGFGTGMLGETFTNWNDPNGTSTRAAIAAIGAKKIHDLSGAAVSMSEAPRFTPFVPTVTDPQEVSRAKLEKMLKEAESVVKEQFDYYSPTNGYREYKTPAADAFRSGGEQAPPPPSTMPQSPMDLGLVPGAVDPNQKQLYTGGATKTVDDPAAVPIAEEYRRRLGAGQSADQLIEYLRSAGVDNPELEAGVRGQVQYRQKFPLVPLDKYPVNVAKEVPVAAMDRAISGMKTSGIQTAAINAADELTGNNLDSITQLFGGNAEVTRQNMNALADLNPTSAAVGRVAGVAATTIGGEGALAKLGMKAGLGRTAAANALAGGYGSYGGTDYNSSGGQATIADRMLGATGGAATNALAGVVGTGVVKATGALVKPVARAAVRSVGADANVSTNQIARALQEDGLTPSQAAKRIAEAQSRGVPMSLADVGENTRELLASVGRSRGESRSIAKTVTANRQAAQLERISTAVRRDLGPTANIRDLGDELMMRAKDEAAPLYKAAFEAPGAGAVSEKIAPILNRPSARRAMVRAERIAAEEGRDPKSLGFDLNAQGEVTLTKAPSWETLHYIKTGLDDVIESYRDKVSGKLVLDAEGRLINNTKNHLLKLMDKYNPTYGEARAAYAGPASLKDALHLGTKAFNMAPDDVAAQIGNLGPSEKEMYRLGLRKGIVDLLGSKGDYADKIKTLIGTPKTRAVLTKVLGGRAEFDRFMQTLQDEQELFRTYNAVNGNSATAGRTAFDQTTTGENIAAHTIDVLQAGKTGGLGGMVASGAEKVMQAGQLGAGKAGDKARADIAALLAESDPATLAQIAKQVNRARAQARLSEKKGSTRAVRGGGTVGGAIAGALSQQTTPGQ